jgi:putative copper resistance protein D
VSEPLIWMRAIHFIATISVVGTVFFTVLVAGPSLWAGMRESKVATLAVRRIIWIGWISLLSAVLSWAGWLVLIAAQMSDLSVAVVLRGDPVWTVLTQTDFGQLWIARVTIAILLAGVMFSRWPSNHSRFLNGLALLLGTCLVGTLAWAGHAGAEFELTTKGIFHLTADALHLIAAAAWVGALVPLALVLRPALGSGVPALGIARSATVRFSTLGVLSVTVLGLTGAINSWVLAGSVRALTATDYGHLLLVKVALFLVMLSVAAINRLRLTPNLLQQGDAASAWTAAGQLRRNAIVEAGIGVIILAIVAVLGTMPPGIDEEETAYLFRQAED